MTYSYPIDTQLPPQLCAALQLPASTVGRVADLLTTASQQILQHYNSVDGVLVDRKADSSPITAADRASHDILCAGLLALNPDIPVLSEESPESFVADRDQWSNCWLVDPLDGTREFISRTDAFTINIALIHEQRAVLGFIQVPVTNELYIGLPGVGAWRCTPELCTPLRVRQLDYQSPLGVLASVRHSEEKVAKVMSQLNELCEGTERVNAGSAIKFCKLVDGEADIYPRTSPCYEWDVAAGDAIVTAAGGFVWNAKGEPMAYNVRDTLLVNRFVAGADSSLAWVEMLYPD